MTAFKKEDYIKYRLEKAEETLYAAQVLMQSSLWNSAVNRLYYACFYAVNALLVQKEITAHTHTGVKTQFFQHYVKTEKISQELGKLYADRQKGDYNDFYDFEKDSVTLLYHQSVELIKRIKTLIDS